MSKNSWTMNKLMNDMFNDRTIFISGELGGSLSTDVVSQLLLLDTQGSSEDIKLYIDSAAGSLSAGFAVHDAINYINSEVSTWAIGTVESVASFVLCSGAPGKRYALPASDIILRQPGRDEARDEGRPVLTAGAYEQWTDEMVRILSKRTGQSPDTVTRDLRGHRHLSAVDSVAYGIVDHVVAGGKFTPQSN